MLDTVDAFVGMCNYSAKPLFKQNFDDFRTWDKSKVPAVIPLHDVETVLSEQVLADAPIGYATGDDASTFMPANCLVVKYTFNGYEWPNTTALKIMQLLEAALYGTNIAAVEGEKCNNGSGSSSIDLFIGIDTCPDCGGNGYINHTPFNICVGCDGLRYKPSILMFETVRKFIEDILALLRKLVRENRIDDAIVRTAGLRVQ